MGEIADMMCDGTLCQGCGVFMGGAGDGFPRCCSDCARGSKADRKAANVSKSAAMHAAAKKIKCVHCGKRVSTVGMPDHVKDVHG